MIYKKENGRARTYCKCICDCGSECIKEASHLQSTPDNASCGCMTGYYRSLHHRSDEIGQKYGRLTIISIDWNTRPAMATCKCECGNEIQVSKADVISGHTQSCGCLQRDATSTSNTKDFSGVTSSSGVVLMNPSYKNQHGVWMWNCICPLCGEIFTALPAKVISNHTTSCGCRLMSSPERIIHKILSDLDVDFETQYRFVACKDKYTLPFDFAIFDNDHNVISVIEYDGRQHFIPVPFWGGATGLSVRQSHDRIKTDFCKTHNIPLLRLSYLDNEQNMREKIANIIYP